MLMQGIFWMIPACCTIEAFKCLQAVQMFHIYEVSTIILYAYYINYKLLNDMSTIDMADDRRWRETDSTSWS